MANTGDAWVRQQMAREEAARLKRNKNQREQRERLRQHKLQSAAAEADMGNLMAQAEFARLQRNKECKERRERLKLQSANSAEADINPMARAEFARLQRNKDRRERRERLKLQSANSAEADINSPGPATPATSDVNVQGSQLGAKVEKGKKLKTIPGQTARTCANCGASGHIKTDRGLCPMLNGEWAKIYNNLLLRPHKKEAYLF